MYLRTFKICVFIFINCSISFRIRISMASSLKNTKVKLDLLTDIDMLIMVEKGIRGRICHAIDPYPKAYNKYMKGYDRNKEC